MTFVFAGPPYEAGRTDLYQCTIFQIGIRAIKTIRHSDDRRGRSHKSSETSEKEVKLSVLEGTGRT